MQAITNLSEVLDLTGRTEEALAEIGAGMEALRANPERTSYDTFMELQGVNFLIRLGRLAELEAGLPAPKFGDEVGTTPIFLAELRARVALLTGDAAPRRAASSTSSGACASARWTRSGWSRCTRMEAQLALLEERHERRARRGRRGLAALDGARTARGSCGWRGSA